MAASVGHATGAEQSIHARSDFSLLRQKSPNRDAHEARVIIFTAPKLPQRMVALVSVLLTYDPPPGVHMSRV